MFGTLATYGRDPDAVAKARGIVQQYMSDPNSVDAAIAGSALSIPALDGNADLYDKYMVRMKRAKTPEEYYHYFGALGQFPSEDLAKRIMGFALGPEVKNQDLSLVTAPLQNVATQAAAWEFFKSNFKAIMGKADVSTGQGLAEIAGVFCEGKLWDDSQDFFTNQNIPRTERARQNAKDKVNACIEFRLLQQANLSAYLKNLHAKGEPAASH